MGKTTFTKTEMKEILSHYNIGKFKQFGEIKKNDVVSLGQIIRTTKGNFFMKILRNFDYSTAQSLKITHLLKQKKFPTYKTYLTRSNRLYLSYQDKKIVFFEYIPYFNGKWKALNYKEIDSFAKTLAKFHKLSKDFKIKPNNAGTYQNIQSLINEVYLKKIFFSSKIKNILTFMNNEIKQLKCPKNQYSTGYYSEFNPGHILFKNNKVKYVIDWNIGKANAFYDYGSSMATFFYGEKFYPNKLKQFIISYNKERPFSKWEKKHLFEAFKFGVLKYCIWGFIDLQKGEIIKEDNKIDKNWLRKVTFLMNFDKCLFNKLININ